MAFQMSFPLLGVDQLVAAFSDLGMSVSELDFKQPKRESWEPKFAEVITIATGCSQESLYQPHLPSLEYLSYPELHENSIPLFHINKAICRVLYTCGVSDFKITDITEPRQKRLTRFCSAIINFLRFQQERLKTYERIKEENESAAEHSKILDKENEELSRQINAIKAARAENEPEIQKLSDAILGMSNKLQENQDIATQRQKDCASSKQRIAEKRAHLAKLKQDAARDKQESNRLSGLIVQSPERMKGEMERMQQKLLTSPERMKGEMERMQQKLLTLKYEKDELVSRLMEYKKKMELKQTKMNNSEQALKLITGINEQIQREKETSSEIGRIRDSIQMKKEEQRKLELKEQTLRRMSQAKQDKLAKVKLQQQGKITSMKENLEHYIREKENMEAMNSQEQNELSRIQEEIKQLAADQVVMKQQTQLMIDTVMSKYSEILTQVDSYHKRLGEAWEDLKPELQTPAQH